MDVFTLFQRRELGVTYLGRKEEQQLTKRRCSSVNRQFCFWFSPGWTTVTSDHTYENYLSERADGAQEAKQ